MHKKLNSRPNACVTKVELGSPQEYTPPQRKVAGYAKAKEQKN